MRIVNFRLLGLFLLLSLVISVTAYFVHGYQNRRNAGVLLRQADLARERKRPDEAIGYLERYIMLVPGNSIDQRAELGILQADLKRFPKAYGNLEAVLRLDRTRLVVRRRLVDVVIGLGRIHDACDHLGVLLDVAPDDSELLELLADCYTQVGEYTGTASAPRAKELLNRAIEAAPGRLHLNVQLAVLLRDHLKDGSGAIQVLKEMVERNVDTAAAYVIRGTFQLESRDASFSSRPAAQEGKPGSDAPETMIESQKNLLTGVLQDARLALELAPDDDAVILFATRSFLANDRLEEAQDLARRGLQLYPKNALIYGLLANLELRTGHRDEAISWLKRGLQAVPKHQDLLWNLALLLIEAGNVLDAEKTRKELWSTRYPRPPLTFLESRILIAKGEWLNAARKLTGLQASLGKWPDLLKQSYFWLGQCHERLGRIDLQLLAFSQAIGVDPLWIPARLGVARALLGIGRFDQALEEYRLITRLSGAPTSTLTQLARLEIYANFRRDPSERDWGTATHILDRLEQLDPNSATVVILRAEILVARDQKSQAEESLLAARDRSPESLELWLGLVALAERGEDDGQRAWERLNEAQAAVGDAVLIRLARARHLAGRRGVEAKEAIRELAVPGDSWTADERVELFAGLATVSLALGDFEETERLGKLVAEAQPTNLPVRLLLFDLSSRSGKISLMEQILEDVKGIEGSGPLWRYGEAVRLNIVAKVENRPDLYKKAKDQLNQASIARPAWSLVPLLQAQINEAEKDQESAIHNYLQAIRLGERSSEVVSQVVDLLYQRGRMTDADKLIRNLQAQQSPFSAEMNRLATEISLNIGDRDRALLFVTKAAVASKEPKQHVWVGRIFSALEKNDDAEEHFRKAIELDTTATAGWVALVQFLGKTKQIQRAEAALKQAETSIKPKSDVPLALAQSLEFLERHEEAEARYQTALEITPDDAPVIRRVADFYLRRGKIQEAGTLFTRIVKGQAKAGEEERFLCRRSLALTLLPQRDPVAVKRALALIEENLVLLPQSVADLRVKALLLSLSPDQKSRVEAAELLEGTLAGDEWSSAPELLAESRLMLAQLYVGLDAPQKAALHFRKLATAHDVQPRYVIEYIRFLISQKEFNEAELWLNPLEKQSPGDLAVAALAAEVLFVRERYQELLTSIDKFVKAPVSPEGTRQPRARNAAMLLEGFAGRLQQSAASDESSAAKDWAEKFLARANELYRVNTEERPEELLAQAAFYGRQGRFEESLEILERVANTARPEEIAAVVATLPTSPSASAAHFARAEKILVAALEQHNRPTGLLIVLANQKSWQGEYDDAERYYREVLKIDNDDPSALNNLALLLALRGQGGQEPLKLIEKALKLAGPNPTLLDSRAAIKLSLGDAKGAGNDLTGLLRGPQANATYYFHKALVDSYLNENEQAQQSLSRAKELGLRLEDLHPLERIKLQRLQRELK